VRTEQARLLGIHTSLAEKRALAQSLTCAQESGNRAARSYASKLQRFHAFAQPELRRAIADLRLEFGMRVLDAGCGTGEALGWLSKAVGDEGTVVGIDLAAAHTSVCLRQGLSPMLCCAG
jgi:cyclopropane fatty-acyl-phospholipid synthase-like methyltransferase